MTTDPDHRPSPNGTAVLIALAVGGWLVAVGLLVVCVPRAKKQFDEFGLQLPWLTARLLDLGTSAALLGVAVGVSLLLAGAVYVCRHRVRNRGARWLGLLAAFGLPVVALAVIVLALVLPMVKMAEGLNR